MLWEPDNSPAPRSGALLSSNEIKVKCLAFLLCYVFKSIIVFCICENILLPCFHLLWRLWTRVGLFKVSQLSLSAWWISSLRGPELCVMCHAPGGSAMLQHVTCVIQSVPRHISHLHTKRVIKLNRSRGRSLTAGLWGSERTWEVAALITVCSGARLLMVSCIFSYARPAPAPELLTMGSNKNPSLSLLTPSRQRPAQGFHFTGQELSSDLFCDVSFRHENMNCNTIPRTILSSGPCLGPDKIKYYQFEPSVKASYQYWKQIQIKHFVSLWALLLCRFVVALLSVSV